MATSTPDFAEIKKQLEYYFSDDNLKKDEFFHNIIESSADKSIALDVFLKCNKIKKLNVDKQALIDAIKDSDLLEPTEDQTSIKRKGSFHLPELEPKLEKKVRKEGENGNANNQLAKKEENLFDPVIFQFKTENPSGKTWKDVQSVAKEILGTDIPYTRFNKAEGHLAIDKNHLTAEAKIKLTGDGFEIEGEKFFVKEAEGEDLKTFYDNHGFHFQNIIETSTKQKVKGREGKKKNTRQERNKKRGEPVALGNQKFDDVSKVKNVFKQLLQSTADSEEIKEPHHSMLHDLLKFHDNFDNKSKDLKNFTAGPHPTYNETRCFFIVRNNGEKEDFSTTKCYNKIQEKLEGQ